MTRTATPMPLSPAGPARDFPRLAGRRPRRDRGQRLGQGEPARVERLADDRALDVRPVRRGLRPARRRSAICAMPPDAMTGAGGGLARPSRSSSTFGPAQRAVLAHVGDDVAGAAVARRGGRGPPRGRRRRSRQPRAASRWSPVDDRARRARRRPARRASAIARAHHSGSSSAAVPRLTRAQPVASARSSEASSRMPPDSSTCDVQLADDRGEQLGVGAAAERGVEVDEVDPLGAVALPGQRRVARVAVGGLGARLALDEADGLAVRDVDGGEQREGHGGAPYRGITRTTSRSQLRSTVAPASPDFSGWNWVAASAPFSTAATKSSPWWAHVTSGGRSDVGLLHLPPAHGEAVHEVEAGVGGQAREQRGARGRAHGVPAHVRQDVGLEALDGARPLPAALGALAPLDAEVEQHLHADADAEHRPAAREPSADDPRPVDGREPRHARGERPDAGHDQPVGVQRGVGVRGDDHVRPDPAQRALRGAQVARSVVQHDDPRHRTSLRRHHRRDTAAAHDRVEAHTTPLATAVRCGSPRSSC